jgi:hypothetical protein
MLIKHAAMKQQENTLFPEQTSRMGTDATST